MTATYKDYYEILGVDRKASQDEIQKAYRKLARQYHPDINKESGSEDKFKEINEAYEVLRDPEKRKRYDSLGNNWKAGQDFTPPPGWDNVHFEFHTTPGFDESGFDPFSDGGFSEFFESLFGGQRGFSSFGGHQRSSVHPGAGFQRTQRGSDVEAEMEVSLEEVYRSVTKSVELQSQSPNEYPHIRKYDVKIPPGTKDGTRIRLSGQGGNGRAGGQAGDLFIRIRIRSHPTFQVKDFDLETEFPVAPWEAALGADVKAPTLDGPVTVHLPSGISSGQRIRLQKKGLPKKDGSHGDEYLRVKIVVPKQLTKEEEEAFQTLAKVSSFKPRS